MGQIWRAWSQTSFERMTTEIVCINNRTIAIAYSLYKPNSLDKKVSTCYYMYTVSILVNRYITQPKEKLVEYGKIKWLNDQHNSVSSGGGSKNPTEIYLKGWSAGTFTLFRYTHLNGSYL